LINITGFKRLQKIELFYLTRTEFATIRTVYR
jgi:hypothetical protein